MTESGEWYWCLRHNRVEPKNGCRAEDRMGPYESQEAAEHWKDRVEQRNLAWEQQDEDD